MEAAVDFFSWAIHIQSSADGKTVSTGWPAMQGKAQAIQQYLSWNCYLLIFIMLKFHVFLLFCEYAGLAKFLQIPKRWLFLELCVVSGFFFF